MKTKEIAKWRGQSIDELTKEVDKLKDELITLRLENKVNPPKDTNTKMKKRNILAVLLTLINEKKLAEIKNSKS